MTKKQYQKIAIAVLLVCLAITPLLTREVFLYFQKAKQTDGRVTGKKSTKRVVIDIGHGGFDPGKVGINGALEKDVNLEIGKKLDAYLQLNDVETMLTRAEDISLSGEGEGNKKVRDMKARVAMIEQFQPDAVVSIHQNSYPSEEIKGAQVFYHRSSERGKKLAGLIQHSFWEKVDSDNNRVEKENASYYLLKKTQVPLVIVECGFLSNTEEAAKLSSPEYQDRIAYAICMGLKEFLNQE